MRNLIVAASLVLGLFGPAQAQAFRCGKERWDIKTGKDSGAKKINLSSPKATSISQLSAFSAPNPIPDTTRVKGPETTLWKISGTLTAFKFENDLSTGDSDYHLVIADASGLTLIAEIPFPQCVATTSPFAAKIRTVRAAFDARFTPSGSFQNVTVPVTITGVGMFDFAHGQRGRADNGIEIHPVLDISFGTANAPPSVTTTGLQNQLLDNPGFEDGGNSPGKWQASAGVIDNSNSEPAHQGKWKAWLGGTGEQHTDRLSQEVAIPASAKQATLEFWLRVETDETTDQERDTLTVEVEQAGGGTTTLEHYSNLDAATFHKLKFDMADFIGKTVTVRLVAAENNGGTTSFIVDDFALTVK